MRPPGGERVRQSSSDTDSASVRQTSSEIDSASPWQLQPGERTVFAFFIGVFGLLSGAAQFIGSYLHSGIQTLAVSGLVVVAGGALVSLPRSNPNIDSYDAGFDSATEHAFVAVTNVSPGSDWVMHSCYLSSNHLECASVAFGNSVSTTGKWVVVVFVVDQKGCELLTSTRCAGPVATLYYPTDPSRMVGDHLRARSDDHHVQRN